MRWKLDTMKRIYLMKFISSFHMMGAVMIPFFTDWGGLNFTKIFFLQAWFSLWLIVLEIPTGIVADRMGRKKSLLLGMFITGLAPLVYAIYPNFWIFLLAEFLWALGGSFNSGAIEAFVYDYLKRKKETDKANKVFARVRIASRSGAILALPIGSIIAASLAFPDNLRLPMALTSVTYFMAITIAWKLKEPKIKRKFKESYFQSAKRGLEYLARHEKLRALSIDKISVYAIAFIMIWLYQALLIANSIDILWFGFVAVMFNMGSIASMNYADAIERKFGLKNTLLFSGILVGVGFLIAGIWMSLIASLIGIVLVISMFNGRNPIFDDYMNRHIKSENRATVLSGINMVERIAISAIYIPIGILTDLSLQGTLIILGIAALVFTFASRVKEEQVHVQNGRRR